MSASEKIMLSDGEFHSAIWEDGVEVWVTQMGSLMNMNTAFVDRETGTVATVSYTHLTLPTKA